MDPARNRGAARAETPSETEPAWRRPRHYSDLVVRIRAWERELRAVGSDWESGTPAHVRLRVLKAANQMLRVLMAERADL